MEDHQIYFGVQISTYCSQATPEALAATMVNARQAAAADTVTLEQNGTMELAEGP